MIAVVAAAWSNGGSQLALAGLIGGVAGFALYHASFGFTAGWRRMVTERRGAGLRAQFVLIVLVAAISFPLLQYGADLGLRIGGFVFPFGVSAALGAFMFGLGMQLGGGCGSGTLFTAGGGSSRMMITLAAFIAGSVIATAHMGYWNSLPAVPGISLVTQFGAAGAFALTAGVLALIALGSVVLERRAHGALEVTRDTGSLLRGPWSMLLGAVMIAGVSIATFLVLGRPWGITSGFALWGAKIAGSVGVPVETWEYWKWQTGALERSVFADATSVMNFTIMAGAMAAAALAGKYRPTLSIDRIGVATAIAGGLLMGYGARLAFGCNIGAYLGGIVSGSVHGWFWFAFGFAGSLLGTRIRRALDMG
nr:YeeE/YedE family protein [Breoghania sp. L-A4]